MDRSERLASILAAWRARRERGESLAPEEVVRRHPDYAEELRARFAAIERVEERFGTFAAIPTRIGEFRIVREIGRGGMGIVYEAEQASMRRRVALKVLLPSIVASPRAVQRFQREAQAAGSLKHTNIVAVHQLGQEGGVWFCAMELVEGRPLSEVLDDLRKLRRATPPARGTTLPSQTLTGSTSGTQAYYTRIAGMFAEVAEALEVAHEHGVVHRDIKPGNLLLDTEGRLKIVDFGLARLEDAASMTVTGDVVGTPHYMSPEQILGHHALGPGTDVYSLGATLYEALTLRPPFAAPSLPALIERITRTEPRRPRRRDRSIPRDLETIVLKALERDPGRRYRAAGEMAEDLRRLAKGMVIRARPVGPVGRAWRTLKRHKVRSALAATLLIVLALGAGALVVANRESARRRALEYEAIFRRAELAATAGWSVHESLLPTLDRDSPALALYSRAIALDADRWPAYLGRALIRANRPIEQRLADVEAARRAGLPERTAHLARAFLFSEGPFGVPIRPEAAAREAEQAAHLPAAGPLDACLEGRVQMARGQPEQAEQTFTQVLDTAHGEGPLRFLALLGRGSVRCELGKWQDALEDWIAVQQLFGDESLETRTRIAALWWRVGSREQAGASFGRLLEEASERGSVQAWYGMILSARQSGERDWTERTTAKAVECHPDSQILLIYRCDELASRGEAGAVLELLAAAPARLQDWRTHNYRGRALARLARFDEALAAYEDAVRSSPGDPGLHVNRATALVALGRDAEAQKAVDEALSLSPRFAPALAVQAFLLTNRGEAEKALASATTAVECAASEDDRAWALYERARALQKLRRLPEALANAEKAVQGNPRSDTAHTVHARILADLGRYEDALRSLDRAIELHPRNRDALQARALLLGNQLGRPVEALAAWETLLATGAAGNPVQANLWIANLELHRGNFSKAQRAYEAVLAADADPHVDRGLVLTLEARCLAELGDAPGALEAYERGVRAEPPSAAARANFAAYLNGNGQFARALDLATDAHRLDGNLNVARYLQALALVGLGRHAEAAGALDEYVHRAPEDPDGYFERARLRLTHLKQYAAAEEDARRVIALEPGGLRGHAMLGDVCLLGLGRPREALAAYEAALEVAPRHPMILANRAMILANEGREVEAKEAFEGLMAEGSLPPLGPIYARFLASFADPALREPERAERLVRVALSAAPDDPDALNTLAVVSCARGAWREAITRLERAMARRDGGNGSDWIYMALAHAHLGNREEARTYLERSVPWIESEVPTNAECRRVVAELKRLLDG